MANHTSDLQGFARPPRSGRHRRRVVRGACLAAGLACTASGASAQVLEIASDGTVTTYAGPTVFTPQGARAIDFGKAAAPMRRIRSTTASAADLRRAADGANLSLDLIAAVAWRESRLRGDVVSPKGAVGEMQLMPSTARSLGVDPADGAQNVRGGASYLRALMRRYDGDLVRALAAYNAGTAAVDRYGGVPPYKETQAYVAAVLDRLSQVVVPLAPASLARR